MATMECRSIEKSQMMLSGLQKQKPLGKMFPGLTEHGSIFRIVPLAASFVHQQLDSLSPGPSLLPEVPRRFSHLLTPQHPTIHFQKEVNSLAEVKQMVY